MEMYLLKLQVLVLLMSTFKLSVAGILEGYSSMPSCFDPFNEHRIAGKCVCPSTYPYMVEKNCDGEEKLCCTTDSTPRECKCRFGYAYHIETDCCYKIKYPELTIQVNNEDICQNRSLTPKEGDGCCIMELNKINNKMEKHCHCKSPYDSYRFVVDKCRRLSNL